MDQYYVNRAAFLHGSVLLQSSRVMHGFRANEQYYVNMGCYAWMIAVDQYYAINSLRLKAVNKCCSVLCACQCYAQRFGLCVMSKVCHYVTEH